MTAPTNIAKKLLIVDDSRTFRDILKDIFKRMSLEILEAETGANAVSMVRDNKPECIILDFHLPDMDGFEVCRQIREIDGNDDLPVIMVTANDSPEIKVKAFDAGVTDFFQKEVATDILEKYVHALFKSKDKKKYLGRVIVAENSNLIRKRVCEYLKTSNIDSIAAESGQEVLELASKEKVDLIVTSMVLSDMSGEDLISKIRATDYLASTPIVVVSSNADKTKIIKAFWLGANDYIVIPFQRDEFLMRVYSHLELCKTQNDLVQKNELLMHEISQRKIAEENFIKQKSFLERVNKELDSFAYTITHDLRAPLRTIIEFSKMIQEDFGAQIPNEAKEKLEKIVDNGKKLNEMINDIFEYSKIGRHEEEKKEKIDGNILVEEILDMLESDIKRTNAKIQIINKLPEIYGYKSKIRSVFINLISNGLKYVPEGMSPSIKIGSEIKDGKQWIYCKDNGIGIDQSNYKRIFTLFGRLHDSSSKYHGSGIGLSIVKKIVDLHGGQISITSKVGEGTTFYLNLDSHTVNKEIDEMESLSDYKILLIDDRIEDRIIMRRVLEKNGYNNIIEAADGAEGLQQIMMEDPDLAIVDTMLPDMSGFEVCKNIKEDDPDKIKVVIITGVVDAINAQKAKDSGADDYTVKTLEFIDLINIIKGFQSSK